jgi:hypothetical protein
MESIKNNDEKLRKYMSEVNNEGNDGWTKLHFQKLYDKRLEELNELDKDPIKTISELDLNEG